MSMGSQGISSRQPVQLEQFTRIRNLGELARLQRSPARACASEDSENSSSQSSGSQKKAVLSSSRKALLAIVYSRKK